MTSKLLLTLNLVILSVISFGQVMTVNTSIYNASELIQDVLINGCVTADNITNVGNFSGSNAAIGYFNANGTSFPFSAGIIMSSGLATAAPGSGSTFASTSLNLNGDSDLDGLLSGFWTSNDAVILEFDFVPSSDTISFRYIFGSEEYPEYVNSSFNDVFGFFITGPNPSGGNYNSQNIALIPGTTQYVSIDGVNNGTSNSGPCTNCSYYVDNSSGPITVYDGLTVPLTAWALVTPCQSYHIKLAIADAGDEVYDSGVFIEAGSFSSGGQVSMNNPDPVYGSNNDLYEGCDNYYVFSRLDTTDLSTALQVQLSISGFSTAQMGDSTNAGDDITSFPTTFSIPIGQIYDTIWYHAYADSLDEGTEYIIIQLLSGCPCSTNSVLDTIFLYDRLDFKASMTSLDVMYCDGNYPPTLDLTAACQSHPVDFVTFTWSTSGITEFGNWNGNVSESVETITPVMGSTTYYVTIADLCGNKIVDSVTVLVSDMQPPTVSTINDLDGTCNGQIHVTPNGGNAPYTYHWWYNNASVPAYLNQTDLLNLCSGTYKVVITDAIGCEQSTTITIIQVSSPICDFTVNYSVINTGTTINFTDISQFSPTSWSWTFAGGSPGSSTLQNPSVTYNSPGSYQVSLVVTNPYGNDTETKVGYITVNQSTPPTAMFVANVTNIIQGQSVTFTDLSTNTPTAWDWDFLGGNPSGSYSQNPPAVTYINPGTFTVSLTVANIYGQDIETITGYITVTQTVLAPNASFSPTLDYVCTNSNVHFTDQSANIPTSWSWTFANGTPSVSNDQSPTVTWNTPGTYSVGLTATNAEGSDTEWGQIVVGSAGTLSVGTMPTDCGGSTGTASVSISNGNSPFTFHWSDNTNYGPTSQPSHTNPGLSAGIYGVTVTDDNGCVVTASTSVLDAGGVVGSLDSIPAVDVTCFGGNDGELSVVAVGGTPPYGYYWSTSATTSHVTGLAAGVYYVTVIDANDCIAAGTDTIDQPVEIEMDTTIVNETAPGSSDGSITVHGFVNAVSPITYAWSNGATTGTASGLTAGDYSVTITDAIGCTHSETYTVISGTSIGELNENMMVQIYPNPSKGIFHIDMGELKVDKIEVVDMLGKTLMTNNKIKPQMDLNLEGFANGIYFIKFTSGANTTARKVRVER